MKRLRNFRTILGILILAACVCTATAQARMNVTVVAGGTPAAAACTENCADFIYCQNAEGAGYDNSETWTETGSTVNEDYTTTVLRGSQSIYFPTTGSLIELISANASLYDEVWVHFQLRIISLPTSSNQGIIHIQRQGVADVTMLRLNTDGTFTLVQEGGGTATTAGAYSTGTNYHVWVRSVKSTGSNGVGALYIGTTSTRPGSAVASFSNGGATNQADRIVFKNQNSGLAYIIDQIYFDNAEIGNVCD